MEDIKKLKPPKKYKGRRLELKVVQIAIKQVKPLIWASLIVAILGAVNYQGEIFTLTNPGKFITGLNEVAYQCLVAYITGCILLFLFELLPKTKKRIAISSFIGNKVHLIVARIEYLLNEVGKKYQDQSQSFDANENIIQDSCAEINVDNDLVNVWYYPQCTFREFIVRSCEDVKTAVNEILAFSDVLNEKWAFSLSRISTTTEQVLDSLDIRYPVPKIEFYWLWGLYAESKRLSEHRSEYDKSHFRLAFYSNPSFHPQGLIFHVNRKK